MVVPREYDYCPHCAKTLETFTEEEKSRKYCDHCKKKFYHATHVGVVAIITDIHPDLNHCVLLVQRNSEPFKDTFMFPGGFLEFGETRVETLARELDEELGLGVVRSSFVDELPAEDDDRQPYHLVSFYHTQVAGIPRIKDPKEIKSIRWVSILSMPDIGFSHHKKMFDGIKFKMPDYFPMNKGGKE